MTVKMTVKQTDLDAFTSSNVQLYGYIPSGEKVPEGEYLIDYTGEAREEYEYDLWGSPATGYVYFDYLFLKPTDGFKIDSAEVNNKVGTNAIGQPIYEDYVLTVSDGGMKAQINEDIESNGWIINTSEAGVIVEFYTFTQSDFDVFDSYGITALMNGEHLTVDYVMVGGDELILNIDLSNKFSFCDESVYFEYLNDISETNKIYFTNSNDDKTATLSLIIPSDYASTNSLIVDTLIFDVTGANNIYITDDPTLKAINSERYTSEPDIQDVKDWGEFILSVKKYPFKMPDSYVGGDENVQLATRSLTTTAPIIINENLIIDVGEIEVLPVNGNLVDYKNSKCILHLPFIKPVELDVNYVIGNKINVKFKVNLNSGDLLVLVSSDSYGGVFAQFNDKIGFDVPYISNAYSVGDDVFNVDSDVYNDVNQCYVELLTFENPFSGAFFNVPVKDYGTLNGYVGYVEVGNIELKSNCYSEEKEQLISLLKNGVIIYD